MAATVKRRISAVWEYFEEPIVVPETGKDGKQVKKVACKLCDQQLTDGGGTTNLMSHLRAKHPEQYKRITDSATSSSSKQTTLSTAFHKCSPQRSSAITDLIAEFVARDLRPLSVVDGVGFRQLLGYIEPGYKVPSRTHVTSICSKKYRSTKESLLASFNKVSNIALTSDIWTSRATQAYLTITCHFITADWKMEGKVLLTQEMHERHTGVHISERLMNGAKEWKIEEKISAVVRDNAANMVLAMELLEDWSDQSCFGHTLQLAVNAGLDLSIINRLTAVCRKIVGHFRHSVVAMGALRTRQTNMSIPQHNLLQDVSTRWNSTYFMYDRLAEQRWAIYAVIHDELVTPSSHRHLDLAPDQWDLLNQLIVVLKPLQVATTALCKAQNISSSLIHPVVNGLVKCHLKGNSQDLVAVKRFKEIVTAGLLRRFPFDPENVAILATAVDPRYHHLKFFTTGQQEEVHTILQQKVESLYEEAHSKDSESEEPSQPKKKKKVTAMTYLLGTECDDSSTTPTWKDEIEKFQKEPQLHHDADALSWWKTNEERFPTVAKLARQFLCIPATSVPSERIFSTAGHVINCQRSSLTPENADILIFLNKNL